MITYKITYKDSMSNGKWQSTTYTTSREMTRKELVEFFGLDNPDVYQYRIERLTSEEI